MQLLAKIVVTLWLFITLVANVRAELQPWNEAVFDEISRNYGSAAEQRMRKLYQFISDGYELDDFDKAKKTNYLANNLPWIADRAKYSKEDYWATPLETITTFGGDCEDIAITKLVILRAMGVPPEKLRLAQVEILRTGESHMVLTYNPAPEQPIGSSPVYVLDNYAPEMLEHHKRVDLKVIYTVDYQRNIRVFSDDGKQRKVVKSVEHANFNKVSDIQDKIAVSRAHYQKLNDGRPLF